MQLTTFQQAQIGMIKTFFKTNVARLKYIFNKETFNKCYIYKHIYNYVIMVQCNIVTQGAFPMSGCITKIIVKNITLGTHILLLSPVRELRIVKIFSIY